MLEPLEKTYRLPWGERITFGNYIGGNRVIHFTNAGHEHFVAYHCNIVPKFVMTEAEKLLAVLTDGSILRISPDAVTLLRIEHLKND